MDLDILSDLGLAMGPDKEQMPRVADRRPVTIRLAMNRILNGTSPVYAVRRTICWGTHSEARRICPRHKGTRRWAHAWVRRHMETLPLQQLQVLDAGSGLSNRLLDWYRPRVRHAYLLDFLLDSREEGNTSIVRADLEKGMPIPDASVDLVTSVSSIEHLSGAGQVLFFREAQRVLRPGGMVAMTVSYKTELTPQKLQVLSSNPILRREGFTISARLDLRKMLEAAPALEPPELPDWSRFPGFDGFSESQILADRDIILDTMYVDETLPTADEVNSLRVRWAEIGLFLVKRG
jgi:SAM-dependent methyltransferase